MVRPNHKLDVLAGMILLVLCHVIAVAIGYVLYILGIKFSLFSGLVPVLLFELFSIGLTQVIYVVPLCMWLRRRRQLDMMKGVIIAATITVLLNGSCFLVVLNIINNMHY